jgi:hypothetical protein
MNEISEIRLGSILFSLSEPAPGYEREYHRWYERDHFFAGCMAGPNYFSGRRWVATRPLKAMRFPADTPIAADIAKGSYLHTYWILAGTYPETLGWSVGQVQQLYDQKRMLLQRENVSSAFYRYVWGSFRDPDGVPPELALEHPYPGIGVVMIDRAVDAAEEAFDAWLRSHTRQEAGSPVAMTLCLRPEPLPEGATGNVPRPDPAVLERRYLLLSFLEVAPGNGWAGPAAEFDLALTASGLGKVIYAAPFIPTVPGTDKYVDEL